MEKTTLYFDRPGKANTDGTLSWSGSGLRS